MLKSAHESTLVHIDQYVKRELAEELGLLSPVSMRHHKVRHVKPRLVMNRSIMSEWYRYGVARSKRIIPPGMILRRFSQINRCLRGPLGMTPKQAGIVQELLRLWAYYVDVYPKASQIVQEVRCSKATYWRTIAELQERGLITVTNRYIYRPEAQISNLYRLDKLIVILARFLAEHGAKFTDQWIQPFIRMPGAHFWSLNFAAARDGPAP